MEDLIRQAFLHVDVIGPHVAEGHYDLVGPNGDIILPQVWETVVEPDWAITMHMWPVPDKPKKPKKPKSPDLPEVLEDDPNLVTIVDPKAPGAHPPLPPPPPIPPPPPDAEVFMASDLLPFPGPLVDALHIPADGQPPPPPPGPKKPRPREPNPGAFAMWMIGNRGKLPNKPLKAEKKPEVVPQPQLLQHDEQCCVM